MPLDRNEKPEYSLPQNNNQIPLDRMSDVETGEIETEGKPTPGRNIPAPFALANAVASLENIISGKHPSPGGFKEQNQQLQPDGAPPVGNMDPKDGINPFIPRNPTVGPNMSSLKKASEELSLKEFTKDKVALMKGYEIVMWVLRDHKGQWAAYDEHGYSLDREMFNSPVEVLQHLLDLKKHSDPLDLQDPLKHHKGSKYLTLEKASETIYNVLNGGRVVDHIVKNGNGWTAKDSGAHPSGNSPLDVLDQLTHVATIHLRDPNNLYPDTKSLGSKWDDPDSLKNVPQLGEQDQWGGTNAALEDESGFHMDVPLGWQPEVFEEETVTFNPRKRDCDEVHGENWLPEGCPSVDEEMRHRVRRDEIDNILSEWPTE